MVDIALANQSAKSLVGGNTTITTTSTTPSSSSNAAPSQIIVIPQSLLQSNNATAASIASAISVVNKHQQQQQVQQALIKTKPVALAAAGTQQQRSGNMQVTTTVSQPRLALKRPLPPLSSTTFRRKSSINSSGNSSDEDDCSSNDGSSAPVRKRANLDHLTTEEKLMRRKLKNRVAAQNARDKKRAKMEDMEDTIEQLREERELLRMENKRLQELNARLSAENQTLRSGNGPTTTTTTLFLKEEMPPSPESLPRSPLPIGGGCAAPASAAATSPMDQTVVGPRLSEPAERNESGSGSGGKPCHGLPVLDLPGGVVSAQQGAAAVRPLITLPQQPLLLENAAGGNVVVINANAEQVSDSIAVKEEAELVGSAAAIMESCQDLEQYLSTVGAVAANATNPAKVVVEAANTDDATAGLSFNKSPSSPADSVDSGLSTSEPAEQMLDKLLTRGMDDVWEESFSELFPDLI